MSPVLFREHKTTFGPYLRELRLARGVSLRDAAGRLGISFAKLQKMETGGRFRIGSSAIFDAIGGLYERPVTEVLAAAGVQIDVPAEPPEGLPGTVLPSEWEYTRAGGWRRLPNFDWRPMGPPDDELEDCMVTAGYSASKVVFGREEGFLIEVHEAVRGPNRERWEYLVWVNFNGVCRPVAVPTFPDLVALLAELKPLADPPFLGLVAARRGLRVGGKRVALIGLTADGYVQKLTAEGAEIVE